MQGRVATGQRCEWMQQHDHLRKHVLSGVAMAARGVSDAIMPGRWVTPADTLAMNASVSISNSLGQSKAPCIWLLSHLWPDTIHPMVDSDVSCSAPEASSTQYCVHCKPLGDRLTCLSDSSVACWMLYQARQLLQCQRRPALWHAVAFKVLCPPPLAGQASATVPVQITNSHRQTGWQLLRIRRQR